MQLRLNPAHATRAAKVEWFQAWSAKTGIQFGPTARTISDRLGRISFAELEEFGLDVQPTFDPVWSGSPSTTGIVPARRRTA
jgi:hypothetical protein